MSGRGIFRRGLFAALLAASLGAAGLPAAFAATGSPRDILLDIVSACMDRGARDYCTHCRSPRTDSTCAGAAECRRSTEVYGLDERFVAMRDIKMCGCPGGFFHGLVLPRFPVRGVEDAARPDDIWDFAWKLAVLRLRGDEAALVVNPARRRTQDQLHVHIVKLKDSVAGLLALNAAGTVATLGEVWGTAAQAAVARGLADYGVLVRQGTDGRFEVVITIESPEDLFTVWKC
jgi:CDP-diacylglycerol pyrophosphatase